MRVDEETKVIGIAPVEKEEDKPEDSEDDEENVQEEQILEDSADNE